MSEDKKGREFVILRPMVTFLGHKFLLGTTLSEDWMRTVGGSNDAMVDSAIERLLGLKAVEEKGLIKSTVERVVDAITPSRPTASENDAPRPQRGRGK